MKKKLYNSLLIISLLMVGCDDFLSKVPNKGADEILNKSEQIDALLNNSEYFNTKAALALTASDDYGFTMDMYDQLFYASEYTLYGLSWKISDLKNLQEDLVWYGEFNKIFLANLIINEIDEVSDLTEESRTEYLAQAHFLRAVCKWELVNLYCQPYATENLSTLGLPLKATTSYEEDMTRATLQETYTSIESDLLEALKTNRNDIEKRWLASKPAVQAMLARFYLFTQDYEKAQNYAIEALKSQNASLQDYNNLEHIEQSVWNQDEETEVVLSYSELYGYAPVEYTDHQEFYYARVYQMADEIALIPSESLIQLYDRDNDLRFEHCFVKSGLLEQGMSGFGEDIIYHKFNHYLYGDILPSGPTVPEMILTQAEAMARLGNWQQAMNKLTELREKRMRAESDITLEAANQEEAIVQILNERHREMPFVMRWYDIRRLAYNETTIDDVAISRTFYGVEKQDANMDEINNYTLPVKSKQYAQPLTSVEIARSHGQLIQNEY